MKIMPYKMLSKSARTLRRTLGKSIVKFVNPEKTPRGTELVVNWGSSKVKPNASCRILNSPANVKVAINKLSTFQKLLDSNVQVPKFTTDVEIAKTWVNKGYKVLARYKLCSHSGNGIIVANSIETLPTDAPLYVRYYVKKLEFRVHVFNGQVIDYVQKKARSVKPVNFNKYIRNYNYGWIFSRRDIVDNQLVKDEAIKAVQALGLDFGAVDVIVTKNNKVIVLEVNCAPAVEGTTITKYAEVLRSLME